MEFIDKTIEAERAHNLIKVFLKTCSKKTPYPVDLYYEMRNYVETDKIINPKQKNTYRLLLELILEQSHLDGDGLQDEEGYCCYCMRKIHADSTHSTLEHVIPKTVDNDNTYQQYFRVKSMLEKRKHIMVLKTVYVEKWKNKDGPCPHNVAYENLVASCDGSLPKGSTNHVCCNGARGDHYIPPLIFIRTIKNEIRYTKSGMVIWKDSPDIDKRECCRVINDILKLNNDILIVIRMIWYYLSKNGLDCTLTDGDRRRVLDTLSFQKSLKRDMIENFRNDNYWSLLEEYRYFNDTTKFTLSQYDQRKIL